MERGLHHVFFIQMASLLMGLVSSALFVQPRFFNIRDVFVEEVSFQRGGCTDETRGRKAPGVPLA